MRERTDKILHKYSESLSNLVLPSEIVQTLYTEGVFSKEIFDEVKKVGGSLSGGPLRALSNTVSENFSQLQVFATILLQSEDTVCIANNILKEYGKLVLLYCYYNYIFYIYRSDSSISITTKSIRYFIWKIIDIQCLTINSS